MHLLDCHLVFDPKTRGLQVNNCIGMEFGDNTYYIKADTAANYNAWLEVRYITSVITILYVQICIGGIMIVCLFCVCYHDVCFFRGL